MNDYVKIWLKAHAYVARIWMVGSARYAYLRVFDPATLEEMLGRDPEVTKVGRVIAKLEEELVVKREEIKQIDRVLYRTPKLVDSDDILRAVCLEAEVRGIRQLLIDLRKALRERIVECLSRP